jgi:hypothetical protein
LDPENSVLLKNKFTNFLPFQMSQLKVIHESSFAVYVPRHWTKFWTMEFEALHSDSHVSLSGWTGIAEKSGLVRYWLKWSQKMDDDQCQWKMDSKHQLMYFRIEAESEESAAQYKEPK